MEKSELSETQWILQRVLQQRPNNWLGVMESRLFQPASDEVIGLGSKWAARLLILSHTSYCFTLINLN